MKRIYFLFFSLTILPLSTLQAQQWQFLYDSALFYFGNQDFKNALDWGEKALEKAEVQFGLRNRNYAQTLDIMGDIHLEQNDITTALAFYDEGKSIFEGSFVEEDIVYANILDDLGNYYYRTGNYKEAQSNFWNALLVKRKTIGEKHASYSESLKTLATFFEEIGNYEIAERIFLVNVNLTQSIFGGKSEEHAYALTELGSLYSLKGDTTTAPIFYRRAEGIYQENNAQFSLGNAFNFAAQGEFYYQTGFYTAAEALFRKALYIYQQQSQTESVEYANVLYHLGNLYLKLNNLADAAQFYSSAGKIYQEKLSQTHPYYGRVLQKQANIYLQVGYHDLAELLTKEVGEIYENSIGRKNLDFVSLNTTQAILLQKLGKVELAEQTYQAAIDTFQILMGNSHPEYARLQAEKADIYYSAGQYEDAISLQQLALQVRKELLDNTHPDYVRSINELSQTYWAGGMMGKSQRLHRKSVQNYLKELNRFFAFLSEKEKGFYYKDVRLFFEKFNNFVIQRRNKKPKLIADMYNNQLATKGLLFYSTQKIREQVLASNDESLKDKFKQWQKLREALAKVYKLGENEAAKRGIRLDSLNEVANYLEKELALRVELSENSENKKTGQYTWEDVQKKLGKDEAAIEIIRLREFLPDSGGYFTDEVFYAALIINSQTEKYPELILIENGKLLETEAVEVYRSSIEYEIEDEESYNNFWAPIKNARSMKGINKAYISVDGVYNQININSLLNPETGEYILDEIQIRVLTSTRDLIERDKAKLSIVASEPVLFGFPNYMMDHDEKLATFNHLEDYVFPEIENEAILARNNTTRDLNIETRRGGLKARLNTGAEITELPGTKIEIESIQKILAQENIEPRIRMGNLAYEGTLKDVDNPEILHIGTHGFFLGDQASQQSSNNEITSLNLSTLDSLNKLLQNEENPLMRSGLMFAGAAYAYSPETILAEINAILTDNEFDDGILTAYEAMNLSLDATNLVALSACETGLGVVQNGEGVYGLQRAFQAAGAETIIMSLWKVSDTATQKLFSKFYEEYVKSKNKQIAFQKAQQALRDEFEHPYYWGAFVMIE